MADVTPVANRKPAMSITTLFTDTEISADYVDHRTSYSDEIFQTIRDYCGETLREFDLAVDVGCGPGKSTVGFSKHFKQVIGVDISDTQIAVAPKDIPNCQFRVGDATDLNFLGDGTVDLFASGLAINLMPVEKVLAEADRVLKPGGTVAIFGYPFPSYNDKRLDALIELAIKKISPMPREFALLFNQYEGINIPYPNCVKRTDLKVTEKMSYKGVKSIFHLIQKVVPGDTEGEFFKHVEKTLAAAFPQLEGKQKENDPVFDVTYDVFLLMGHKPSH